VKDALTKFTFGFFMAQLFPGAITAMAVTMTHRAWHRRLPGSVAAAVDEMLGSWSAATAAHHLALLGLCVGFGMSIHGLHWATLGALERGGRVSIFRSWWHRRMTILQVLLAPLRMTLELFCLAASSTRAASIHENVPSMRDDQMKQHEFLQEFYLYSAQFFAHTAWALVAVFIAVATFIQKYGPTTERYLLLALLYVGIGVFFTTGRIQLCSLFRGEADLKRIRFWTWWEKVGCNCRGPASGRG
jgi:hypothetical protein